jgi:hypothetical protein
VIADVIGREGVVLPSEDVVGNASLYRPIEVVEESDDDESEDSDSPTGWDIVYRVGGDGYEGVLFADRASAEYVARIRDALYNSTTWGQFRAKLPTGEWEQKFGDDFDEDWADDKPFEADCAPGHGDGDYPEWLLQSQLDWFPHELIEKYGGTRRGTALNGDALELPADRADEIAEDLRAMGHTVERTDLDIA